MPASSTPYQLRVGVTGHRNLSQPTEVAGAVQRLLEHVRSTLESASAQPYGQCGSPKSRTQRFDSRLTRLAGPILRVMGLPVALAADETPQHQRTAIEWTVVSALAKGADRLVARTVLKLPAARLEVVTPLPLDEYRKDFVDEDDRGKFEDLLSLDPRPTPLNPDFAKQAQHDPEGARRQAYLEGGHRVVDSCEMLIAVWDGKPAGGKGGTAEVVKYALEQDRTVFWIDDGDPRQPVRVLKLKRHVRGPQAETARWADGPQPGMVQAPLPERAKQLSLAYHRLAAYNRDVAFDHQAYSRNYERQLGELNAAAQQAGLHGPEIDPVLMRLLPHHVRADYLAVVYQRLHVFAATWLFRLSAIAVTVVVLQILYFPHANWLIIFEILAMLSAVVLLRISRNEAWHEKWLYDRHLAEWLRSAMFTVMLGEPTDKSRVDPARLLPFYHGPDNWYVDAFRGHIDQTRKAIPPDLPLEPLKKYLIQGWMTPQTQFHRNNARKKKRLARLYHRAGLVLFIVTLLMALAHLAGVGHGNGHAADGAAAHAVDGGAEHGEAAQGGEHGDSHGGADWWALAGLTIVLLAIILPAWGASIHAIGSLMEYERMGERSERMAEVLAGMTARAAESNDRSALRQHVAQAEEIMALENYEWLVSLSFRGPILPT